MFRLEKLPRLVLLPPKLPRLADRFVGRFCIDLCGDRCGERCENERCGVDRYEREGIDRLIEGDRL